MKRKITMWVGTPYVGSEWKEEITLDFPENATRQEIEEEVEEYYKDWVWENINTGFQIEQ